VDLALSETQSLIASSLRQLLSAQVPMKRIEDVQDGGGADTELWQHLADGGWLALPFSAAVESDGTGGLVDLAIAVEEVARSAAIIPFVDTMAAAAAIFRNGTDAAREAVVLVEDGSMTIAPALAARAASGHGVVVGRAGLDGRRRFVDYGQTSTHHLVEVDGGLHLVEVRPPTVITEPVHTIGRTPQADATYLACPSIPAGDGVLLDRLRAIGTVLCAVELLGYAQFALDLTVGYVRDRHQFGRPLGSFQAVQHHCADMATMIEATRFLAYEAVWKVDRDEDNAEAVAVTKAAASRTALFVTLQAHQLHGGIGVTEEYPLHFYSRRAKDRSVAWASVQESMNMIADAVHQPEPWV
jgi:alkylation response protein AidB-like acyl-CoA dehydrogenase